MIDFLIIGGTKCGSTSLADYVKMSKRVNFCKDKEPSILNKKKFGENDIRYYESLFDDKDGLKGEATPAYSDLGQVDTVIENLNKINAKPKIILSVRSQKRRIESSYIQKLKSGKIDSSNTNKIPLEPIGVIHRGMYGHVISKYAKAFTLDSILVLNFDELVMENSKELVRLRDFLKLEDDLGDNLPQKNKSIGASKKNKIQLIYKKYISKYWRRFNLPSLSLVNYFLNKVRKKVNENEFIELDESQMSYLKEIYKDDLEIFIKMTGWSYWELKR